MKKIILLSICINMFAHMNHASTIMDNIDVTKLTDEQIYEIAEASKNVLAPTLDNMPEAVSDVKNAAQYTPVVFMHGMGDSGSNPGMKSLCASAPSKYPGMYSVCANVANGAASIFTELGPQVDEFAKLVQGDPKLANGFNVVGLSQGNLVVRGYIEAYNDPPVKKFINICGPNFGIGTCPDNFLYKLICPLWKLGPYTAKLAFSDYWKDATDEKTYLSKSRWLAYLDNDKTSTNSSMYKKNFASLEKLVLVQALNDTIVVPKASELFGFWEWGQTKSIVPMEETEGYKKDFIGLKTLNEGKKIDTYHFIGDHLRFSNEFWKGKILPYLGN